MSRHTFQIFNSSLVLLVLWLNSNHPLQRLSLNIFSLNTDFVWCRSSLSLLSASIFISLLSRLHRCHVPFRSGSSWDSGDTKTRVCPLLKQCSLTQWKDLSLAYWHGVSHHPGSAQRPGHCCCRLCVSSSCIGTACTWSPENRQEHPLLLFWCKNRTKPLSSYLSLQS